MKVEAIMIKRVILSAIFFLCMCSNLEASPDIRVGIVNMQNAAVFSSDAALDVLNSSGEKIATLNAVDENFLVAKENSFMLGENEIKEKLVIIRPSDGYKVTVNKRTYRGVMYVYLKNPSVLSVVNKLSLEEYLYGTLPNETLALWPEAALAAESVVNRTNAYYAMQHSKGEYDILAVYDEFNQAYYGFSIETQESRDVIDKTKGEVLTKNGSTVKAYYHSSSGGRTEDVAGSDYLKSVTDYDQDSPNYKWEREITVKQVEEILKYAGFGYIGTFQGFEFSALDEKNIAKATDRTKSGRLKEVKVLGNLGFAMISGEHFATLFVLPSAAFDIGISNAVPEYIEVPIEDRYGNVLGVKKIPVNVNIGKPDFSPDRPNVLRVTRAENEMIVIRGKGEGDGIGFSKWGARGIAQSMSNIDYKYILGYYYQGASVRKVY